MPFGASLKDPVTNIADVAVDGSCSKLTIGDNSNYDSAAESGHTRAEFDDLRILIVERPDFTKYRFSSITGDGDEVVSPASSANDTIVYNFLTTDKDGIYTLTLYTVPTWMVGANYDINSDHVFNPADGLLYKALTTNSGQQPDTSPTDWVVVLETDLPIKYCVTEKVAVTCIELLTCYERVVHDAVCLLDEDFCNDDLFCKNKKALNAMKLRFLLDAIAYAVQTQQWQNVEKLFNLAKTICNCR